MTPHITTQAATPSTQLKAKPKTPSTTQISWANRVRVTDFSTRFTLEPLARQPSGHRLKVSEEMLSENAEQWTRCMVGFFPGFRMPYHAVNTIASRVWKHCGLENVTTTSNGFMIFRFTNEEQMLAVLEKGPWMFGGKNIVLQQWHPRIQFDKNKISTLPVWIRLHGLPFPLWSKQGLSLAASMVGRPLSCDESTFNCTRLEYARVCVEIDASLPYTHEFDIDSPLSAEPITIKVEYEWKPNRCEKCSVFGHSCTTASAPASIPGPTHAPILVPSQAKGKAIVIEPQPLNNASTSASVVPLPIFSPLPTPNAPNTLLPLIPNTPAQPVLVPTPVLTPPIAIEPLHTETTSIPITQPPSEPTLEHVDAIPQKSHTEHSPQEVEPMALNQHHTLDTTKCMERKMDSLKSHSDASSAIEVSAETSTASIPPNDSHDDSPSPSPKTVRKKKGGRKRKETRGL